MPYLHVDSFTQGMDRSRKRRSLRPGSLFLLENAHVTRGGDIQRAKSFVPVADGLEGTFGIIELNGQRTVFAGGDYVGAPAGVLVQRLVHPTNASQSMRRVLSKELFDGKPYVIAQFTDGSIHHYYDGAYINDFATVVGTFTSLSSVRDNLLAQINQDPKYSAAAQGPMAIRVTGPDGIDYTTTASVQAETDPGEKTVSFSEIQAPGAPLVAAPATATLTVVSGSTGNDGLSSETTLTFSNTNTDPTRS